MKEGREMQKNQYITEMYNRKKSWHRICLGISYLKEIPLLNFIWIILGIEILLLEIWKNKMLEVFNVPEFMLPIFSTCLIIIEIILPIFSIIAILKGIGELVARKEEVDLIFVFKGLDIKGREPIMVKKKKIKKKGIVIREYYSKIPLEAWQERKETIADVMNVTFVEDITYGGKGNRNGNFIVMKTVIGRKPEDRGVLYDDTF